MSALLWEKEVILQWTWQNDDYLIRSFKDPKGDPGYLPILATGHSLIYSTGIYLQHHLGIPLAAGVLYPVNGFLLNPMIAGAAWL